MSDFEEKYCPVCSAPGHKLKEVGYVILNQYADKLPPSIRQELRYALQNTKELERELEIQKETVIAYGRKFFEATP